YYSGGYLTIKYIILHPNPPPDHFKPLRKYHKIPGVFATLREAHNAEPEAKTSLELWSAYYRQNWMKRHYIPDQGWLLRPRPSRSLCRRDINFSPGSDFPVR